MMMIILLGVKAALILSAAVVSCLVFRAISNHLDRMVEEMEQEAQNKKI